MGISLTLSIQTGTFFSTIFSTTTVLSFHTVCVTNTGFSTIFSFSTTLSSTIQTFRSRGLVTNTGIDGRELVDFSFLFYSRRSSSYFCSCYYLERGVGCGFLLFPKQRDQSFYTYLLSLGLPRLVSISSLGLYFPLSFFSGSTTTVWFFDFTNTACSCLSQLQSFLIQPMACLMRCIALSTSSATPCSPICVHSSPTNSVSFALRSSHYFVNRSMVLAEVEFSRLSRSISACCLSIMSWYLACMSTLNGVSYRSRERRMSKFSYWYFREIGIVFCDESYSQMWQREKCVNVGYLARSPAESKFSSDSQSDRLLAEVIIKIIYGHTATKYHLIHISQYLMIDSPYQRIFDKGVQQFKGKQSDAAIQSFSDAIALKPERFAPYLNRGTIYLQLNLLSQALSDFNRSIELDPRDPTGYFNRAIVRLKENRPSEALSDLYITLSCLYLQRGESTREIKFLTKAISLVENNVHAYLERGKLYKIKGNNVLAENDFSGAIELDGQNMEAFALRGSLYRDMKQDEASQRDTKVVLALSKEGKKKPLALNPQLKPMNDAQINQEILTKLKEIAEMRNALAAIRVDIGGERDRSERLIQQKSEKNITAERSDKAIVIEKGQRSVPDTPLPTPLQTPITTPLPTPMPSKQVVQFDSPLVPPQSSPISIQPIPLLKPTPKTITPHKIILQPQVVVATTEEPTKQNLLKAAVKSQSSQELLMEQHKEPKDESKKQEISHDSKVDDSDVIDDRIGKIQTEIEECRKEMIEEGGSSVFDSKVEDNLLELSNPLLEKSKDHNDSKDPSEIKSELKVNTASVQDNVTSSLTTKPQHPQHSDFGVQTDNPPTVQTRKSIDRPKSTLQLEIVAGALTHNTELFGNMSPYCSVVYNGEEKKTRVIQQGGKNPVWNDKMFFPLAKNDQVKITVWDKESLKRDDLVGEGVISIEGMSNKCQLLFEGKPAGHVYVKIRLL